MALAIFDSRQVWGAPHAGLQLFGTCGPAAGRTERRGRRLYSRRFPRFHDLGDGLSHLRLYAVSVASLKILDEEEFGDEVFVSAEVVR